jgi:hypothetical protein
MRNNLLSLCFLLCFTSSALLSAADQPIEWETVSFTFPMKVKGESDAATP